MKHDETKNTYSKSSTVSGESTDIVIRFFCKICLNSSTKTDRNRCSTVHWTTKNVLFVKISPMPNYHSPVLSCIIPLHRTVTGCLLPISKLCNSEPSNVCINNGKSLYSLYCPHYNTKYVRNACK